MTFKAKVHNYVRVSYPGWVSTYAIEEFARLHNKNGETGARTLRELYQTGTLEKEKRGKYIRYRWAKPVKEETFSDVHERLKGKYQQPTIWSQT